MDEGRSSPERPLVKVTYLDRQKRKRTITESSADLSHPKSATTDTAAGDSATTPKKAQSMMKLSSMKAPDSRGPQKINMHLPGPAVKRARRDSNESIKSTVPADTKKSLHSRSSSSISLSRAMQATTSAPTSAKKPASITGTKPTSSRRPASPDTEIDDSASIADSVMSTSRLRRTELERIEYFKNEPECGTLEENRAECTRCGKFVSLGRKQKYTVRPWEIHRLKCDQKRPKSPSGDLDTNADPDEAQDNANDKSKPSRAPQRTAEQRKAALEADPRISVVKPHEVLCRNCGRWIRLSGSHVYKDYNWKTHTLACDATVPSKWVATATRKLQLVNDPHVKSFTSHKVVCSLCDAVIISNGEDDYNIINWEEHKTTCSRPHNDAQNKLRKTSVDPPTTSGVSILPFPGRPPPSSASTSTEGTLVVSDAKHNSQIQGIKRLRDDDDVVDIPPDDPNSRPSNRPRTEAYEAPAKEAPSPAGWLMLPFKAFVRGFKESLKRS